MLIFMWIISASFLPEKEKNIWNINDERFTVINVIQLYRVDNMSLYFTSKIIRLILPQLISEFHSILDISWQIQPFNRYFEELLTRLSFW